MAQIGKGIGPRIAAARKTARLTQEQLGERVGHSTRTIQSWELGVRHPRHEALFQLADALGISVADLYTDAAHDSKQAAA